MSVSEVFGELLAELEPPPEGNRDALDYYIHCTVPLNLRIKMMHALIKHDPNQNVSPLVVTNTELWHIVKRTHCLPPII